jgi:hypothetical protein
VLSQFVVAGMRLLIIWTDILLPLLLAAAACSNANKWLTGLAVGPHHNASAATAAGAGAAAAGAAGDTRPNQALYVCDYSTRGVLKFCTSSLR